MFSFKEAGYCTTWMAGQDRRTRQLGRRVPDRPRRFTRLYPTQRAGGKRSL